MQIRDYSLPAGWFPREKAAVTAFLSEFNKSGRKNTANAAIAPHAGWYYSGRTAALAVSSLNPDAQTIVVIGGHLRGGSAPLFAMEDAARTPFGAMRIDSHFRSLLIEKLHGEEDRFRDNTVEILLPMVHYFFPEAKLIWLRLGEDIDSFNSGKIISQTAAELNIKINALASTDLTHYGANYGFSPRGSGADALRWVRENNDAAFIKAVQSGSGEEVLRRAQSDNSSCSAGAVLSAMGYAQAEGLKNARLLEYSTSADADPDGGIPDSFVGYAALSFEK